MWYKRGRKSAREKTLKYNPKVRSVVRDTYPPQSTSRFDDNLQRHKATLMLDQQQVLALKFKIASVITCGIHVVFKCANLVGLKK